jgi:hypothetical protein
MSWPAFHKFACQFGSNPVFLQANYLIDIYYKSMAWVHRSVLAPLVL